MNASTIAPLLPGLNTVRERARRTALLEFLVVPGAEYRTYGYVPGWRPGWDLATMSNGAGDDYSIVISGSTGLIRCFDHETDVSPYVNEDHAFWPGTVDALPGRFKPFMDEAEFTHGDELAVTALLWFLPGDTSWRTGVTGDEEDGSGWMLDPLCAPAPARTHHSRFQDHYERPLDLSAVSALFEGEPLTKELVAALNPEADPAELLRGAGTYLS